MSLDTRDIDRIIEMAWEDRTPFEAITFQFGLKEQEVIELMRKEMKPSSFRMWRERVQGRATKHRKLRSPLKNMVDNNDLDFEDHIDINSSRLSRKKRTFDKGRFKCSRQRTITNNSISKR